MTKIKNPYKIMYPKCAMNEVLEQEPDDEGHYIVTYDDLIGIYQDGIDDGLEMVMKPIMEMKNKAEKYYGP